MTRTTMALDAFLFQLVFSCSFRAGVSGPRGVFDKAHHISHWRSTDSIPLRSRRYIFFCFSRIHLPSSARLEIWHSNLILGGKFPSYRSTLLLFSPALSCFLFCRLRYRSLFGAWGPAMAIGGCPHGQPWMLRRTGRRSQGPGRVRAQSDGEKVTRRPLSQEGGRGQDV